MALGEVHLEITGRQWWVLHDAMKDLKVWLAEQSMPMPRYTYHVDGNTILIFQNAADAALFKLRWLI